MFKKMSNFKRALLHLDELGVKVTPGLMIVSKNDNTIISKCHSCRDVILFACKNYNMAYIRE